MPTFLLPNQCNSFKGCLFDGASYTNSILSKIPFFIITNYSFSPFSHLLFHSLFRMGHHFFQKSLGNYWREKLKRTRLHYLRTYYWIRTCLKKILIVLANSSKLLLNHKLMKKIIFLTIYHKQYFWFIKFIVVDSWLFIWEIFSLNFQEISSAATQKILLGVSFVTVQST